MNQLQSTNPPKKSTIGIILTIVITSLVVGGAVFFWQQSTNNNISNKSVNQATNTDGNTNQSSIVNKQPTITKGIYGTVTVKSGNCMPSFDISNSSCKAVRVSKEIYIREPATLKDMEGVYLKEKTTLVKKITSESDGFYETALPAGTYSIFIEDEGKEYCAGSGAQGEACQVTITAGPKEYNIMIDRAAY